MIDGDVGRCMVQWVKMNDSYVGRCMVQWVKMSDGDVVRCMDIVRRCVAECYRVLLHTIIFSK